jgi:hypothetical protein
VKIGGIGYAHALYVGLSALGRFPGPTWAFGTGWYGALSALSVT